MFETTMKKTAKFAFYWKEPSTTETLAMYRLSTEFGETEVSAYGLNVASVAIPLTPTFETWKTMVCSFKRCGFCWTELNGTPEATAAHVEATHPEHRRLAAV